MDDENICHQDPQSTKSAVDCSLRATTCKTRFQPQPYSYSSISPTRKSHKRCRFRGQQDRSNPQSCTTPRHDKLGVLVRNGSQRCHRVPALQAPNGKLNIPVSFQSPSLHANREKPLLILGGRVRGTELQAASHEAKCGPVGQREGIKSTRPSRAPEVAGEIGREDRQDGLTGEGPPSVNDLCMYDRFSSADSKVPSHDGAANHQH